MRKTSIYIHFPYCLKKCNYCDFISYPCANFIEDSQDFSLTENFSDLLNFYTKEIELYHKKFGKKEISSIYFGGGTPSLMPPIMIEGILEKIFNLFNVSNNCEITLEVNPKTVTKKKLSDFYQAGINRLSIGIQSFDDNELKFLGRVHSSNDALSTLENAQKYFSNISCDFIYALPNQTIEKWQKSLDKISSLNINHLSLYQLIIEPKTKIYSLVKSGKTTPILENISKKMYEYTNHFLKSKFPQYEISNYAKKGFESKHNLNYWNGGDYIGIGVSASGRIFDGKKHFISENPKSISDWKKNIDNNILSIKTLSAKKRAEEMLIMGLRKNKGIIFKEFKQNSSINFMDMIDSQKLELMIQKKLLILNKNSIRPSAKGRPLLDAIIREIIK